jgi:hypothetical protein
MNLPTKQDLNSAYERIHALSRESREQKKAIAHLRGQIEELAALCAAHAKKAVKPKKTAVSATSKDGKNAPRTE